MLNFKNNFSTNNKNLSETDKIIIALKSHITYYPVPTNLNYNWSFGSLAGIFLASQVLTGIFLACQYIGYDNISFERLEYIMRDVNYGWLLRYMHANGASFFFICLYLHLFRGLYFKSFVNPRYYTWALGITVFLLSIIVAFIGYVLPWGQMSYWGATVITNLVTAFPVVGSTIVLWIWGAYTVAGPTLTRFFTFHFLFALAIVAIVLVHILYLHKASSSNPMMTTNVDKVKFNNYYSYKDLFILIVIFIVYLYVLFYLPNILGHTDNYNKANPMVTPTHIVPEWYFLPFYAILRSVPNKLHGVVLMLLSILVYYSVFVLRYDAKRSSYLSYLDPIIYNLYIIIFILLWIIGVSPAVEPYITFGKIFTIIYFSYFIFLYIYSKHLNFIINNYTKFVIWIKSKKSNNKI